MKQTNKSILANGIRVVTKKIPHACSVSMGIWVNIGSRDESKHESGISHFIEHMMFKGTSKRSAFQIAKEFDAIGSHSNAFTSMEHTCYYARGVYGHLNTLVNILSDIFLNSVFDPQEMEKERMVILQEIHMLEDNPEDYIHFLSGNACFGDHPLGRSTLGLPDTISLFNRDAIVEFYANKYRADRIVISAAGHLEHDHFLDLIDHHFGQFNANASSNARQEPSIQSLANKYCRQLEQIHVCLTTKGVDIQSPQRYPFTLMNIILGGNMSSRLFQDIRENRGLAYSIYSYNCSYIDSGMQGIYVALEPNTLQEALDAITYQINDIKTHGVTKQELFEAKEYAKGTLMLSSESIDNQMVLLAHNELNYNRQITQNEIIQEIDAVSEQDMIELANQLFNPNSLSLVMLGPTEPISHKMIFDDIKDILSNN